MCLVKHCCKSLAEKLFVCLRRRVPSGFSALQRAPQCCVQQGGTELHPAHRQERLPAPAQPGPGIPPEPADRRTVEGYRPRHARHQLRAQRPGLQPRTHCVRDGTSQRHPGQYTRRQIPHQFSDISNDYILIYIIQAKIA